MSNTQKFNPNSFLPIFNEAIFMGTMMKTNSLRLITNTATISSGIVAASIFIMKPFYDYYTYKIKVN